MIKQESIAKALNVSVATVSNALCGKGRMRPEMRTAILDKAIEMGYPVDRVQQNKVKPVVLVIAEDLTYIHTSRHMDGLYAKAEELGYQVFPIQLNTNGRDMGLTPDKAALRELIENALSQLPFTYVGVIYISQYARDLSGVLPPLPCPLVYAYTYGEKGVPAVNYNDQHAAFLATEALIRSGCKKIGTISGPIDTIPMAKRLQGYQNALITYGLPIDPHLIYVGDWNISSGYELAQSLIDQGVDSIFAQNDSMALGVLRALRERGLRVPEDVSVIGIDNNVICLAMEPPLTSVALPLVEIGSEAMEQLHRQLHGAHDAPQVLLPCRLVERNSTRPIPSAE